RRRCAPARPPRRASAAASAPPAARSPAPLPARPPDPRPSPRRQCRRAGRSSDKYEHRPGRDQDGGSPPPPMYAQSMESAAELATPVNALESRSPTTGEVIGSVPTITPAEVQGVVDDVARVQPAWAQLR